MKIYISLVIATILLLFSCKSQCLATVTLVSPTNNSILESKKVTFEIQNSAEEEYVYKYIYQKYPESSQTVSFYKETEDLLFSTNVPKDKEVYIWYVEYHPKITFAGTYDFRTESRVFAVNAEIPIQRKESVEKKEDMETMVVPKKEIVEKNINKVEKKRSKIFQEDEGLNWSVEADTQEILGKSDENEKIDCFFKYNQENKTSTLFSCDIPQLSITKVESYSFTDLYSTIVEGKLKDKIYIQIDEYICKKDLFDPSSWFSCKEKLDRSTLLQISPNMTMAVYEDIQRIPIRAYTQNGSSFDLVAGHSKGYKDLKLIVRYRIVNSKYNIFEDISQEYPLDNTFSDLSGKTKKPFSFPLGKIFGVTQWYGNTEYQKPHSGIDFGVKNEKVLAVENGEVVSVGTDKESECNSGGKYLLIKQSNGMYTGYFHLSKISVKIGTFVKKGDVLGVSGNSGMWNCQALGYHLHFTVRKDRASNTHVNPVKYLNVNWGLVPTLGYKSYPGRLSGENPHPGS